MGEGLVDRLERETDLKLDVNWVPYEIHPEIPPGGIARERAFRGDPERMAQSRRYLEERAHELGLPMTTPSILANTHRALLLAEYARDHDRFEPVHRGLFHAYFGEGRNLDDDAVLREVASGAGLDPDAALSAIGSEEYATRLQAALAQGAMLGISGTPTFVIADRYAIVGAQPYEAMRDALTEIARELDGDGADGEDGDV